MKKQISVNYFGAEGIGLTKSEALKDAQRRIAAVFQSKWEPFYLRHGAYTAIVCGVPGFDSPWGFTLVKDGVQSRDCSVSQCYAARDQATSSAAHGLAQMAGNHLGLERWLSPEMIRDLERHYVFQAAHKAAMESGKADFEAHDIACKAVSEASM